MAGSQSIEGLASNLNTTDIINAIIEAERKPAALMETQQAQKTKEISTFNAISAKLLALQSSIRAISNRSALSQASIAVSNEDILTATAEGLPAIGTYTLNVLSLATANQIVSHGYDDASQSVMGTGTITIALGDRSPTTITIDGTNNSLVGIKKAINDADIGITATIVNDGSGSKPYRLMLTGSETGQKNKISITSSLSGGLDLDYTTSVFDDPEIVDFSGQTTSQVTLGSTASYTGSANKTFTFTVAGNGPQTVGDGNILLNWTDGTDSGSIVVSQSDTDIVGPEGLKLSFGDGVLTGGDTFQVSTFAPVLQQASDAVVSFGGGGEGASPLTIRSDTNTFDDLIEGLTINLKGVTTPSTGPVTIQTGVDTSGITDKINAFIKAYNDAKNAIDEQNKYNTDTKEGGTLLGDTTLMTIQARLTSMISEPVAGLPKSMNTLSAIGIRVGQDGRLTIRDSGRLSDALENNFEDVVKLFTDSGASSTDGISLFSSSANIAGGSEFKVDITQAATHGYLRGNTLTAPADDNIVLTDSNNRIKLRVDGIVSNEIVLEPGTYSSGEALANELQTRISADDKIGKLGVSVEWVDLGGQGYLNITSSSYGSTSRVETISSLTNSADSTLGLSDGTVRYGDDVEGTINGESATGRGQVLTGDEDNDTTAGLKLLITLTQSQVNDDAEGTITVTKGVATLMTEGLDRITKSSDGVIARKTSGLQQQVDDIKQQVKAFDDRLAYRRETLEKKWANLETLLSQLNQEKSYLDTQLQNISSNLSQMTGKG
jgi:flagellar hook-associated protein 2